MTDSAYPDLAKVEDWLNAKGYTGEAGACHNAMDKIRKQAARIAELEAALRPFADMKIVDSTQWEGEIALYGIAARDLRAARAAYLGEKE